MKIGMLIAVEVEAFISEYEGKYSKASVSGFDVYEVKEGASEIYAIHSGAGQVFAAAAAILLIDHFKVDMILNYGVVGSLSKDVETFGKCLVEKVVHYNFDTSEIDNCEVGRHLEYDGIYMPTDEKLRSLAMSVDDELRLVACASGDKFVGSKGEKESIRKSFGADICEMEAAAIVLTCDKAGVPCLLVKTVSDSISGGADEFTKTLFRSSKLCIGIIRKIIEEGWEK